MFMLRLFLGLIKFLNDLLHKFLEGKMLEDFHIEEKKKRQKALADMNAKISLLAKLFPSKFRLQDSRLVCNACCV